MVQPQPRISYEYVSDPTDPSAPPRARRVIDTTPAAGPGATSAGRGARGMGKWWKGPRSKEASQGEMLTGMGGAPVAAGYVPAHARPLPPATKPAPTAGNGDGTSSHSAAQNLTFLDPGPSSISAPTPFVTFGPTPTPTDWSYSWPNPNPHKIKKAKQSKQPYVYPYNTTTSTEQSTGQGLAQPWYTTNPFSPAPPSPFTARPLPSPHPQGPPNNWTTPPVLLQPTPLPHDLEYLPRSERKYWLKMRKDQIKAIEKMEKSARDQMKAQEKEARNREKFEMKRRKAEEKQNRKNEKWLRKHPHRSLPFPTPADLSTIAVAAKDDKPKPAAEATKPDPLSFMLLPTGEEFGVRRPFDAPGLPRALGGPPGQAGWPMMSRTMTHAVVDMDKEERVHAIQAGRFYAPNW